MDFGSIPFIIWFLPVFVLIYYLIPSAQGKKAAIIVGSIFFYGVSCLSWLPYLLGLTVCAVAAAYWVRKKGKPALIVSVLAFTAFLVWNKASDQLMPGVSFVIFTILALLVDTYRKPTEKSLLDLVSYILFFPKLLSGPIARLEQMETRKVRLMGEKPPRNGVNIEYGAACFIIGLGYKVLLANQLAGLWREIQTIGLPSVSTQLAWMGVIGYSLQLYFDFQGYSLMAIGIAKMLGYTMPNNFDSPYLSKSVSEFYRRWHITLGAWFRDYVYIPLGGSRKGTGRTIINLFAVWLLTGLWHGFGVNFLLWGMFLFFWIAMEKIWLRKFLENKPWLAHIYVLLVIPLSWVFFALPELSDIVWCFLRLFGPIVPYEGINVSAGDYLKYGSMYWPFLVAGIFFAFPFGEKWLKRNYRRGLGILVLLVIFWMSVYQLAMGLNNPFIFRFEVMHNEKIQISAAGAAGFVGCCGRRLWAVCAYPGSG